MGGAVSRALINTMPSGKKKTIAGLLAGPAVLSAAYELLRLGAQVKDTGAAPFQSAAGTDDLAAAVATVLGLLEPGLDGDAALVDAVLMQAQRLGDRTTAG